MWGSLLVILQIIKVFLELWKEKDSKVAEKKAIEAKEIVDAFAKANPDEKASSLNAVVNGIRLRNKA